MKLSIEESFANVVDVEMLASIVVVASCLFGAWIALKAASAVVGALTAKAVPTVVVPLTEEERENVLTGRKKFDPSVLGMEQPGKGGGKLIHQWDPCTMDVLGDPFPAMTKADVDAVVGRARVAGDAWKVSSFEQRRHALRTLLKFVMENQETIARVSVRDSGKTVVDAMIGEVLTTCEKFHWTLANGEKYLRDEARDVGALMLMKKVHVEWRPLGVIGAIVPWNYPFHNVFNPLIATIMSGNALVLKVSEYASWSAKSYYGRVIAACLEAAGAPPNLVQFVYGYGETGNALVTSAGVDKVIFVGSPAVGVHVMRAAAENLTPVVLELGGKDPFVVCDDADIDAIVQTACRGVWQNMGQNCAGPERFFVYESCFDEFCDKVVALVRRMKQGPPLGSALVDCGGICMGPRQMAHYQRLVDDAVNKGAQLLHGGRLPASDDPVLGGGRSFYPPTVLAGVPENAIIAQEEIFGPIMCIFKVAGDSDDEAVRMANDCAFALSSCAFAKTGARAQAVAQRLDAGMSAVNDLEGCTYMSQSLPFGGGKKSGFGRFAGVEGLRGLCLERSVCEDRFPDLVRNAIPPPLQYPTRGWGAQFAEGLIFLTYHPSPVAKAKGLGLLLHAAFATAFRPKQSEEGAAAAAAAAAAAVPNSH